MQAKFNPKLILLTDIDVRGRIREDLGEIEEFAESLRDDGLLQPIVVEEVTGLLSIGDLPYKLIAGGRRYTAFTLLSVNKVDNMGEDYSRIPAMLRSETPAHQLVKLEMEENLRRKGMTWQESAIGIVKYHKACKRAAAIEGEKWAQRQTGDMINMDQASVSLAFTVVEAMAAGNQKVINAESLTDAIKAIAESNLDEMQAEQMRRIQARRTSVAAPVAGGPPALPTLSSSILVSAKASQPETVADKVQFSKDQIASFYHHGDGRELLPRLAGRGPINHIIFDPPYAIDTANMVGESIERIADTHQVEPNLALIEDFLRIGFEHIANDGFMCMWYDLDHHEKIRTWAEAIGWKVQRWPFIWCKTSPCRNSQAGYNWTKSTEVCYLLRRSEQSVLKVKQPNNYILEPSCATASHPFVKPKTVWDRLITAVSLEGQTIVDLCAGEGSSLAASFQLKRIPIGVEIDEKHIASGINYIQEQLNKKDILDDIMSEIPL